MRSLIILISSMFCTLSAIHAQDAEPANAPAVGAAWTVPELGMKFAWIKPGTFTMGSPAGEADRAENETQHDVVISKGFWCGVYEVTQGEWQSLMGTTLQAQRDLADPERDLYGEGDRHPMYFVSWDESVSFCEKLTARERRAGRIPAGYAYRLLTESEWEYACRGGTTGAYAGALGDYGWYGDNSDNKTHEVGTKRANAWGLYDMHGNVWEWCLDRYGDYPSGRVTDPGGPADGRLRVGRGGCWNSTARGCRSAFRIRDMPENRDFYIGFRVSLAPVR